MQFLHFVLQQKNYISRMNKLFTCFFVLGMLHFSNPENHLKAQISEDLELMGQWMLGNYNVDTHANEEANQLCVQRIWEDKTNGVWLYCELQNEDNTQVIQQYIYLASDITYGEYSLDKYVPKKPEGLLGGCKNPELFVGLTPFDLSYMDGCTIFLTYDGFQYAGSSNQRTCKENKESVDYKVKEFYLTTNELTILEKLYDTSGNQLGNKNGVTLKYSKTE